MFNCIYCKRENQYRVCLKCQGKIKELIKPMTFNNKIFLSPRNSILRLLIRSDFLKIQINETLIKIIRSRIKDNYCIYFEDDFFKDLKNIFNFSNDFSSFDQIFLISYFYKKDIFSFDFKKEQDVINVVITI